MMPWYEVFHFPSNPDPTDPRKPYHIYDNVALAGYGPFDFADDPTPPPSEDGPTPEHQVIGVHVNGVQLKGPSEAEGYNVDVTGLGLEQTCGGHITPPYSAPGVCSSPRGATRRPASPPTRSKRNTHHFYSARASRRPANPLAHSLVHATCAGAVMYHYHKAANCCHIETPGFHAPLIGYINDGFGIYGYSDIGGQMPVLDECRGHFGPISEDEPGRVVYHYHAQVSFRSSSGRMGRGGEDWLCFGFVVWRGGGSVGVRLAAVRRARRHTNTQGSVDAASPSALMPLCFFVSAAQDVVNQVSGGEGFHAYYLGCQGPALGKCQTGVNWTAWDMGHVYCDDGCGAEVCVQPGTARDALESYVDSYNASWLETFTINDFEA